VKQNSWNLHAASEDDAFASIVQAQYSIAALDDQTIEKGKLARQRRAGLFEQRNTSPTLVEFCLTTVSDESARSSTTVTRD